MAALTSTTYSPLTSVALPDGSTLTKDQVIGYIDDCVNNSGYSLVTSDFRNLWAYTNRFTVEDYDYTTGQGLKWVEDDNAVNPETLFAIKYNKLADWSTSIGYANNFALHFGVRGMAGVAESFPFGQGWGAGPAAPNLVSDWKSSEPNDKRRDASISDCAAWTEQGWAFGGGGDSLVTSDFRNLWAYTNRFTVEDYDYTTGQGLKWVEDDNAVNPETLFAIKYNKLADWSTSIGYANNFALHFGVRGMAGVAESFPFGQGWGAGPAAPNLVSDWKSSEPNDKRRDASISDCAAWTEQGWAFGGGGEFIQETGYLSKKWLPVAAKNGDTYSVCFENLMYGTDGWAQGSENLQLNNIHDLVLIRFADVLLMQSELKENTDGINRVRERAGLSPISSYSLQALQNERRWELAFESIRWNDIRRWHIAAAALEKQTNVKIYTNGQEDSNKAHGGGYATRYNATAGFFKIPESEVDMSNGSITQNAGWEGSDSQYNRW